MKKIDIFQLPIPLNNAGSTSHSTYIGTFCSLVVYGFIISITYSSSLEFFLRQYPSVVQELVYKQIPDEIFIGPKTLPISFSIQDHDTWSNFLDETVYQLFINFQTVQLELDEETQTYSPIVQNIVQKADRCQRDVHFAIPAYDYYINFLDLDNMYCLPQNPIQQLRLGGNYDIGTFSAVQVIVSRCDQNLKENPTKICKPSSEIDSQLSKLYFNVYFPDTQIQTGNPENLTTVFGRSEYVATSVSTQKEIDLKFHKVEISVDEGYVYQDFKESFHYTMDLWREHVTVLDKGDLIYMSIQSSLNQEKQSFMYKKSTTVLSEILSFFGTIKEIVMLAILPLVSISYYLKFINDHFMKAKTLKFEKYFGIKPELQDHRKNSYFSNSISNTNNVQINSALKRSSISPISPEQKFDSPQQQGQQSNREDLTYPNSDRPSLEDKSVRLKESINSQMSEYHNMKFDYVQYFKILLPCLRDQKQQKLNQFRLQRLYLQNVEDINKIGKRLEDIKVIKRILFDQDQLRIMKLIDLNHQKYTEKKPGSRKISVVDLEDETVFEEGSKIDSIQKNSKDETGLEKIIDAFEKMDSNKSQFLLSNTQNTTVDDTWKKNINSKILKLIDQDFINSLRFFRDSSNPNAQQTNF